MSISAVDSVKHRTKSNLKQELVAKQEQQQGIRPADVRGAGLCRRRSRRGRTLIENSN